MLAITDKEWMRQTYDEVVAEYPEDGVSRDDARKECSRRYAEAVGAGTVLRRGISVEEEGLVLFNEIVPSELNARKAAVTKNLDYLIASLFGTSEDEADIDPILQLALPTGGGADKTLKFWTADDWATARTTRYRVAAQVTAAAAEFDKRAETFIDLLKMRKVSTTGELFGGAL